MTLRTRYYDNWWRQVTRNPNLIKCIFTRNLHPRHHNSKIAVKGPSGVNMVVLSYILYLNSGTTFSRNKDLTRKVISFGPIPTTPNPQFWYQQTTVLLLINNYFQSFFLKFIRKISDSGTSGQIVIFPEVRLRKPFCIFLPYFDSAYYTIRCFAWLTIPPELFGQQMIQFFLGGEAVPWCQSLHHQLYIHHLSDQQLT